MLFKNNSKVVIAKYSYIDNGWLLQGLAQSAPIKSSQRLIVIMKKLGYTLISKDLNRLRLT